MKHRLFILTLFIQAYTVNACRCFTDPLSAEVLNRYSFIFIAKVISLKEPVMDDRGFPSYQLAEIEPLEYFKGSVSAKTILVSGVRSSCDMGVAVDETWIFFANLYNDQISIFPCGHSAQYLKRETDFGYDGFMYSSGLNTLNFLRNHFIKYPKKAVYTGKWLNQKTAYTAERKEGKLNGFLTLYDEEGRKIARYAYKDSLLEGESTVWYKNGRVYSRSFYKKGLAVGIREEYASSGRLLGRYDYENGERNGPAMRWDIFGNIIFDGRFKNEKMVDTIRSWYPVDTSRRYLTITTVLEYGAKFTEDTIYAWNQRHQLENMSVYNDSGRVIYHISFYRNGKLRSLLVTEPNTGYKIQHDYFLNGISSGFSVFYYVRNNERGYDEARTIYSENKFNDQSDSHRKTYYNKEGDKVVKVTELIDGKEVVIFPKQIPE